MPKPDLREPFASLSRELLDTMIAGHKEWRPDLEYPESHSDMLACVHAVLRMFDVKRRPLALDYKDIIKPEPKCDHCDHPACIFIRERKSCSRHEAEIKNI